MIAALALLVLQRPPSLERDPRDLPVAEEGRWREWSGDDPVEEAARAHLVEALEAVERGDFPIALDRVYAALDAVPDYPPALLRAGVVHFRLRRYGDAAYCFERLLAVVPGELANTRQLGHCYYSLGQYERARAHYRLVLAREPDSAETVQGLALAEMRLGDTAAALANLERVIELDSGSFEARVWIAQIHYDEGEAEAARAAAERARDLDPYHPRPWFLLSRALFDLGEETAGEEAVARFRELDRAAQEIRVLEGRLLYEPGNLTVLAKLAELHARIGDRDRLRTTLARMIAASPKDLGVRVFALDTLVARGDLEAAKVAALAMEEAFPEDPESWNKLQQFYGRIRDRVKQVQAGEKYLRFKGE
jgi:tetratricopeptide (TPR) repeat protein